MDFGSITTSSAYSSSQTGGVSALMSPDASIPAALLADADGFGFAFEDDPDILPPEVLGGAGVHPLQASATCPESSGSSSTSGDDASSDSSSSSSSSSGCALNTGAKTSPFLELALLLTVVILAGVRPKRG